jgi:putative PIG3 family NAD(P)H quinone oxidoreductase
MRAIVIARPGGPEVLELRDVPDPVPSRGEVRVGVRATAVNRADLLQRAGFYPAPPGWPADIPGMEFAGEIDTLGEGVTGWKVGDRVFGLAGGGAYAEKLVIHSRTLARVPGALTWVDAASIPEAFITAYDAMVTLGGLASGERVLIHAVGSGVGTAASQIARAIGARSIGTARTRAKLERSSALGLDEGIVAADGRFAEETLRLTGGEGVDLVLDLVGGEYLGENVACAAPRGRIVVVGLLAGTQAQLDLGALLRKRLTVVGTMLRSRPLEEKILAIQVFARHVVPLFERGALRAVVDRMLPLEKAGEAHAYVASNDGFGKVVLVVD